MARYIASRRLTLTTLAAVVALLIGLGWLGWQLSGGSSASAEGVACNQDRPTRR